MWKLDNTTMPIPYLRPKLILGEGKADQNFFYELFRAHDLQGFQSDYPVIGRDHTGGVSKIGAYLNIIGGIGSTFLPTVKRLVVAVDNDNEEAFSGARGQLTIANYNLPDNPKEFVRTDGKPDVAILLVPENPPGCLETLCYAAAATKWNPLVRPLETYFLATQAVNWSATKQAKMKVQCMLASTCEPNPGVSLHDHWQRDDQYQIPVTDPSFQSIVDFLTSI
jgi:hypothetical protein